MTGLLEKASDDFDLIITTHIIEELKELSRYSDPVGGSAKEVLSIVKKNGLTIREVSDRNVKEIMKSSIDEGEASCFVCARENDVNCLVMDDIDAATSLESRSIKEGIDLRISAAVIVELLHQDIITDKKARTAIDDLIDDRGWKGGVLEELAEKYLSG